MPKFPPQKRTMEYRSWKNAPVRTSLLGYGCMRFPTTPEGRIDEPRAEALLNAARDAGVNYFDTAYPYHGGESEPFVGRVIAKWPRESFYLATKLPLWQCKSLDEAKRIFADQQKHVKALSSFETFKAHIEADDPKQKMIEAIVQSYGLEITSTKAKNGISAVSTLERIYDKYGQAVLDRTLRLAAATWEGENNSFSGNILMGIARIVVAYGDTVRDDVFKDHVGRVSVKAIIRAAKERRPGALGYSEAMIIEYNKKSKFRLSLKTLYGEKQTSDEDEFGEE